ncbi:MAG: hypothetical protein JW786_03240 [Desulfobacterales bacterium]|nr:hypothetical protein [Desulfobacterales bacterium]
MDDLIEGNRMQAINISISSSAKNFIMKRGITDITFDLEILEPAGCSLGIVKEIEPAYRAAENVDRYYYTEVENIRIYISRQIKIVGPLRLTTEGFWKLKRLYLSGATIPL